MKRPAGSLDIVKAHTAAAVCYQMLGVVFNEQRPLDKVLTRLFRENKRFGSQDRRLISETLFSLCRWYGWLSPLIREPANIWPHITRDTFRDNTALLLPLAAAAALDGYEMDGPRRVWAGRREVMPIDPALPLAERAVIFAEMFNLPVPTADALFPSWFTSLFPKSEKVTALYPWLQKRPPIWLRLQSAPDPVMTEFQSKNIRIAPAERLPTALRIVDARVNLHELDALRSGRVEVQDISSQCIGEVCAPNPGERWLDYCAGAGGKTLQLASLMKSKGTVVAVDKRNWKLDDLRKRARRAGFSNIQPRATEGDFPKVPKASFDGVLVDAPCSCSGTWRRNPDARWSTSFDDFAELADLQFSILERAAKAVKPGGVLVYATCSFSMVENEGVVMRFLESHPDFASEPFNHPLTGETSPDGMLRIRPSDGDGDGMFVARFRYVKR